MKLHFSLVIFKPSTEEVMLLINSIKSCSLDWQLSIVDNSPTENPQFQLDDNRISYLFQGKNLGFGSAHNIALRAQSGKAEYHVVINPDVSFDPGTFEPIIQYLDAHEDTGLCVPRVLYPDGRIQHLCKLVPTPLDLIGRRFLTPLAPSYFESRRKRYEMLSFDYSQNLEVPILSGSCMILRDSTLQEVGFFDERFFLYLEDVDLSRRFYQVSRNLHYGEAFVYHAYKKDSYSSTSNLKLHLRSAIQYFSKWGWMFDNEGKRMNKKALESNRNKRAQ